MGSPHELDTTRTLGAHAGAVVSLAASRDGRWLASVGGDGVIVRNLELGDQQVRAAIGARAVALHPDGRAQVGPVAIDISSDGAAAVADTERGLELRDREGRRLGAVMCDRRAHAVRFSPDGRCLFVGSASGWAWRVDRAVIAASGVVDVTPLHDGRGVVPVPHLGGAIMDASFLPDGRVAIVAALARARGAIALWDPARPRELVSRIVLPECLHAVVVAPGGGELIAAGDGGRLHAFALSPWGPGISSPASPVVVTTRDPGRRLGMVRDVRMAEGPDTIHALAVSGDRLVIGFESGEVRTIALPLGDGAQFDEVTSEATLDD